MVSSIFTKRKSSCKRGPLIPKLGVCNPSNCKPQRRYIAGLRFKAPTNVTCRVKYRIILIRTPNKNNYCGDGMFGANAKTMFGVLFFLFNQGTPCISPEKVCSAYLCDAIKKILEKVRDRILFEPKEDFKEEIQ